MFKQVMGNYLPINGTELVRNLYWPKMVDILFLFFLPFPQTLNKEKQTSLYLNWWRGGEDTIRPGRKRRHEGGADADPCPLTSREQTTSRTANTIYSTLIHACASLPF